MTGRAVRALPRPEAAEGDRAGGGAAGDRGGDRDRRPRLGPVLQLRPAVPEPARAALQRPLRGRPRTTSAGSRSTPSAKSRCSDTAPAPTSSPGTSCARSRSPSTTPTRSTSRPSPSWGWSAGCWCWRWSGSCSGPASAPGATPRGSQQELCAVLLAADRRLRGRRRRSTGSGRSPRSARSSSSPAASSSPSAAPSWRRRGARPAGAVENRRFGLAVAGLAIAWITAARPDRAAAGRPRDRGQPVGGRRRRRRQRRRPRRHRPLDRALGRLALRAAGPARRSCRATT